MWFFLLFFFSCCGFFFLPQKDVVCGGLRLGQVEIHLVCVGRECTFYLKLRAW